MSVVTSWPQISFRGLEDRTAAPPQSSLLASVPRDRLLGLFQAVVDSVDWNWDGEGGAPASTLAVDQAAQFLRVLPETWPSPEIAIERNGSVNLEWGHSADYVFTISVGSQGVLHYAGLYGDSKTFGMEAFVGELPRVVVDNLRRLEMASRDTAAA